MHSAQRQALLEERRRAIDHMRMYHRLHDRARTMARKLSRRMSKEKAEKLSTVHYFAKQLRRAEFTRAWIERKISMR
jgi:hypothetical protein